MKNVVVTNMVNNGRPVANQFIIKKGNTIIFQSYKSTIVELQRDGSITVYREWDYSPTTLKYFKLFLSQFEIISSKYTKKQLEQMIENGLIENTPVVKSWEIFKEA